MAPKRERAAQANRRPDQDVVLLDGEPTEYSPPTPVIARLTMRAVTGRDGRFICIETLGASE
jgi:hypothetical protein